ncbi:FAD-binding oxidoreductase [Halovenus marina]|uniref:FAD-binding oxidoreductase n=1 Tax=Halovenus marina TaxID=3396621 RepID=UPI003F54F223
MTVDGYPREHPGEQVLTALTADDIDTFRAAVRGDIVFPDDESYDDARRVWNGLINRYPALVVRCSGVADIIEAVAFARRHEVPVAVRGGGHSVAGHSTCDGGIVIDLSPMDGVRVNPKERTVRVQGGATVGDLDHETQVFGLAVPGGGASDTGIAGLTLGGGLGHLSRKYGLTCDNLQSVNVVTADGEVVTASQNQNEDLFWALRGGGGNFGVVTSFEFRCHEVGPDIATCFIGYSHEEATEVLRYFRSYAADAPEEVTLTAAYARVPELPEFPEAVWGDPGLAIFGAFAGEPAAGEQEFQKFRDVAEPLVDLSGTMPYTDFQSRDDAFNPPGRHNYWNSLYLNELSDGAIDQIVAAGERAPSVYSNVGVMQLGGRISQVDPGQTAFVHRDAPFLFTVDAIWDDPVETEENIAWAQESIEDMREFTSRGPYVNLSGVHEEGEELLRSIYGTNYQRLTEVKAEYDPTNLFDHTRNIEPAS